MGYKMPSLGFSRASKGVERRSSMEPEKCNCCPYGYHIHRDFVRYSQKLLSTQGEMDRIKDLRDKIRSELQSMNQMLGIVKKEIEIEAIKDVNGKKEESGKKHLTECINSEIDKPDESQTDLSFLQGNGLHDAVREFEEVLNKNGKDHNSLSYTFESFRRCHTFPRQKPSHAVNMFSYEEDGHRSGRLHNGASAAGFTVPKPIDITAGTSHSFIQKQKITDFTKKASTSDESIYSTFKVEKRNFSTTDKLKEKSNEEFCALEDTVSDLKAEIRRLEKEIRHLKRLLDSERIKKVTNGAEKEETESLSPKKRHVGVGNHMMTRDIGVHPSLPRTRHIGVSCCQDQAFIERTTPTSPKAKPFDHSIAPTLLQRKRIRTFDIGVQINDHEFKDENTAPTLQIVEKKDVLVQTNLLGQQQVSPTKTDPKLLLKNVGVSVKPKMHEVGLNHKPSTKDKGSLAYESPKRFNTAHVGTITDADETAHALEPSAQTLDSSTQTLKQGQLTKSESQESITDSEASTAGKVSPIQLHLLKASSSSRIPRLASPIPSPYLSQKFSTKDTFSPEVSRKHIDRHGKGAGAIQEEDSTPSSIQRPAYNRSDTYTKDSSTSPVRFHRRTLETLEEETERKRHFREHKPKATPSKMMDGALKVLNDALLLGKTTKDVTSAIKMILHEWFRVAGTKTSEPMDVEDYLDAFEDYSPQLLRYIVNMPDGNGNTALHYAVSHGNFDVVSVLLDSKVCDPNKANKAGYTSVMLVSLALIKSEVHRKVVRRIFSFGDVNIKASQHGQTALMLGASHGRLGTVKLLLEAGADINIQDQDGSTALMCAAEHGHEDVVKYLLGQPDCDPYITDDDGSNAFNVAMDANHKDIGALLYAHMFLVKSGHSSPGATRKLDSKSVSPKSSLSNTPSGSAERSPVMPSKIPRNTKITEKVETD